MSGVGSTGQRSGLGAQSAISANGNTGALIPPQGASHFALIAAVTAFTGTSITFEVQWSNDGTNFFSADPADTFTAIAAAKTVVKELTVKAPFYRVAYTGTYSSATFSFTDVPFTVTPAPSPTGYEAGAPSLAAATVGYIGSTTLTATFVQGTTSTYSAIKASLAGASRMGLLLKCTANTWTTGVFEILWSMDGTNLIHADATDVFATFAGAATKFKEVAVKAPFFAVTIISGTPGSATFTADVGATAL